MRYAIKWEHKSVVDVYETYKAACAAVREVFPVAVIGHSGDIDDGNESTWFWANKHAHEDCAAGRITVRHNLVLPPSSDVESTRPMSRTEIEAALASEGAQ